MLIFPALTKDEQDYFTKPLCIVKVVSFPDPALKEEKGLVLMCQSDSCHVTYIGYDHVMQQYSQLLLRMRAVRSGDFLADDDK